ncbi:MAG: cation:proton antiporter [Thermoplasmata archaeon]|nr:cation:proton antiporter [Thermoplasmata archaeon]
MEESVLISIMATLIILAAFLSIVMRKAKMPALVGFLAAGIVIANFAELNEDAHEVVELFSNLGLIMLMFSIGMEINLANLKTQGRFAIIVALVQMPLMVLGGFITGTVLGYNMVQSIALGAIISGSSTAVVMAVLKEKDILDRAHVEILVLVMIIEDIGQVIMLSMLTPMLSGAELGTKDLILLIIQIAIFMIVCFTIGLKLVPRIIDWFHKRASDEQISLLCIGALFTLALAASKMGLSVAIGAFLMGIMVAASTAHHTVEHYVDPLKSLFMAMFFISVGMEVSLGSLADSIVLIVIFFLVFVICKSFTVYLGYWIGNGDSRKGFISALSLCAMGEFAFIIAKEALDVGAVDNGFYSAVIGAALISMITLPVLSGSSGKIYDKLTTKLPMGAFHRLSASRDRFYARLAALPGRTTDMLSKAAATVYFNIVMIIIITIIFYYYTVDIANVLCDYLGLSFTLSMVIVLAAHMVILIIPCFYFVKNARLILYVVDKSKRENRNPEDARFYETMNPLAIAGAIALTIIVIIPDEFDRTFEVLLGIGIILVISLHQYWRLKSGRKSKKAAEIEQDETETAEETARDRNQQNCPRRFAGGNGLIPISGRQRDLRTMNTMPIAMAAITAMAAAYSRIPESSWGSSMAKTLIEKLSMTNPVSSSYFEASSFQSDHLPSSKAKLSPSLMTATP